MKLFSKWLESAGNQDPIGKLKQFLIEKPDEEPVSDAWWDKLSHNVMTYVRDVKNEWLIHFTKDPKGIATKGFLGWPDYRNLAYTTMQEPTQGRGYSFAFVADKASITAALARKKPYGHYAVMFRASGIETSHYSDSENQIIFWGPDVSPNNIVQLKTIDEWRGPNRDVFWIAIHRGEEIAKKKSLVETTEVVKQIIG